MLPSSCGAVTAPHIKSATKQKLYNFSGSLLEYAHSVFIYVVYSFLHHAESSNGTSYRIR